MRLTLHKLRRRTTPLSKLSWFCWGGLGYQNNTAAWRSAEGRGHGGWMYRGRLGVRGGSRTDGLGWEVKIQSASLYGCQPAAVALKSEH